ncbi:MAG TPA: TauD/TfdA family dioxygenase [Stellaceae bacterium]|jgi:taurine dioxygenase|nr:TauD/TfdA family dioxygenase [Stellaceae bacterium]
MNYETISVHPLAGALGAEVAGVDLRQPLGNRQWSEVHQAFLEYCAIYIRDQELGGADMLRYARYFAEPAFYPFVEGMPDFPQIFELRKEPDMTVNVGGAWHSDTTYLDKPPIGTMLYAREVPAYGGDTMVANQYLAYEALSPGMQRMLDGLTGVYSARMNGGRGGRAENKYMKMKDSVAKADEIQAEHPVVRTHPETGRKALYVSTRHTLRFKGWTEEESRPVLDFLQAHCTRPEFTARLRWEKGTITIWDNRCVQHFAINDYQGQRRVMWRLPVGAEAVS